MIISQLTNAQGKAVKNQFVIINGDIITFQSYDSQVVDIDRANKIIMFYPDYNYSNTTLKYCCKFLSDTLDANIKSKDVGKMISDGVYCDYKIFLIK